MYFVLAVLFFGGGDGGQFCFGFFASAVGVRGASSHFPQKTSHNIIDFFSELPSSFLNFLSPLWLTTKDQVTVPVKESTSEGIRITIAISMQVNAVTLFESSRKWQYCDRSTRCIHFHIIT